MIQNPSFRLIELKETDSTNHYLAQLCDEKPQQIAEFTTVTTQFQTAGKGQRGNSWESEKECNLLCSIVLYPSFLEAKQQFVLSQIISLSIKESLDELGSDFSIKWPNDIYYKDLKICGILIENDLNGCYLGRCICGIGLNVNQEKFLSDAPNPVSLKQITGKQHDVNNILQRIVQRLQTYYHELQTQPLKDFASRIATQYEQALFRRKGMYTYQDANGLFTAQLVGVESDGRFVLQDPSGLKRSYLFKEVQYVL